MKLSKEWKFKNYRDGLSAVVGIAAGYDGYNPKDAKQMKGLVAELAQVAADALLDKPIFINTKGQSMYTSEGGYRKRR